MPLSCFLAAIFPGDCGRAALGYICSIFDLIWPKLSGWAVPGKFPRSCGWAALGFIYSIFDLIWPKLSGGLPLESFLGAAACRASTALGYICSIFDLIRLELSGGLPLESFLGTAAGLRSAIFALYST